MSDIRDHCIRCGECCRKSSPTLHLEDLKIIRDGAVRLKDLYTIRKGELVRDNVQGGMALTQRELIKFREGADGRSCMFYQDEAAACGIYESRPVQCRALKCWDPSEFMEVYRRPKAGRTDLVKDRILLRLIETHEDRCRYDILESHVREISSKGEAAVEKVLGLLRFDYQFRSLAPEKCGLDPAETDFYFGRPLIHTITMFGLKVIRGPDGSFLLTTA